MLKRINFTALMLFLGTALLPAQYAPGVDWKRIDTEHFTVIFPDEIREQAKEVAGKIDLIYEMDAQTYHEVKQSRWPIILTTSGTRANGYVALPPRKSVWYGTPQAEGDFTIDWYDTLAVHETRHMVQYDRLNRRLNKLLYILGGQSGLSLGITLGVPDWFFEGDAVAAETSFAPGGRGEDPLFYGGMRDVAANTDYSYQKVVNGSYRDRLPNHYEYGYFLTSYVRKTYGAESWDTILDRATLLPLPAFGMYLGAKKVSGKSWAKLYRKMSEDLAARWEAERAQIPQRDNRIVAAADRRDSVRYEALAMEAGGSILARRTSLADPPVLVRLRDGEEDSLMRIPGYGPVSINADAGKAVWAWNRPSPLYGSRSWSDLVVLDLKSGKKCVITKKERFLMPAMSRKGDRIAALEWTTARTASLLILDSTSAEVLMKRALPEGLFPANPEWSEDDRSIYFTLQGKEGRAIAAVDAEEGSLEMIRDFSRDNIKRIRVWGDHLIYASDRSGLENIMALNLKTAEEFQISSRHNGVANPLVAGGRVFYSEFGEGGSLSLVSQELQPDSWIPEEDIKVLPFLYYAEEPAGFDSGDRTALEEIESRAKVYGDEDVRDYSLAAGKFNVHSWGFSGDSAQQSLALSIQSSDIMGTTEWSLGGEYDVDDEEFGTFFNLSWYQFYPVISWNNNYRFREIADRDFHDVDSTLFLSFPFDLSRDIWYHSVTPYAGAGIEAVIDADDTGKRAHDFPVVYGLDWISALPGSFRSLAPLFGIQESLYFEHNPGQDSDRFFSQSSTLYLPGAFRNQSLQLGSSYENRKGDYSSRVFFSRGYDKEERDQLLQLKANYEFPIAYPDLAMGSFAYIKRLRGALFYDYTTVYDRANRFAEGDDYRSVGAELNMEFTALNFKYLPLSVGVRWSWLIEEEEYKVDILLMSVGL